MRRYETIYILRPTLAEEQINTLIENTNNIIQSDDGQIIELDKWGIKKLAYPIKKESLGYYIYCDYAGSPGAVAEMERKFRIDDSILRYLTVKLADAITKEEADIAAKDLADLKAADESATESEQEEASDNSEAKDQKKDK